MKKSNILKWTIMMLAGVLAMTSCTETWDAHYNSQNITQSELNLKDYIASKPELSIFSQMLKISGYDSILAKPQSMTVWAPINTALQQVNLNDTNAVRQIVMNHITRFTHSTSDLQSQTIYMLDKKFITFSRDNAGFKFGDYSLILDKSNIAASNGMLHEIDGYVPYMTNLWEFITTAQGLDSLRDFLMSQSTYAFDKAASTEIGTNEFGQSIYDSIITFSNPILDKIGALHLEDSVYTTLLPNNKAWISAYKNIASKYKATTADGGTAKQRYYARLALVKDLVFKNLISQPQNESMITSTTGDKFLSPGYLFDGAVQNRLSNGLAFVTDSLKYKAAESWQKPIQIEAENSNYGRTFANANLYVRSSLGSSFADSVSETKYLLVEPNTVSASTMATATFPIPNTLSGTYNIYVVFAPTNIIQNEDAKPNKVKFYLSYMNDKGVVVSDNAIDANNLPAKTAGIFTTNKDRMTKMFVSKFTFSYCNLIEKGDPNTKIKVKVRVENAVKVNETVDFSRVMRIDYIILEPAQ